jgi:hypothetical protein
MPSPNTVKRLFGSWREAVRAAGLPMGSRRMTPWATGRWPSHSASGVSNTVAGLAGRNGRGTVPPVSSDGGPSIRHPESESTDVKNPGNVGVEQPSPRDPASPLSASSPPAEVVCLSSRRQRGNSASASRCVATGTYRRCRGPTRMRRGYPSATRRAVDPKNRLSVAAVAPLNEKGPPAKPRLWLPEAVAAQYRYGDSNPGFRTEKLPESLRLVAAVLVFGFPEPYSSKRGTCVFGCFRPSP